MRLFAPIYTIAVVVISVLSLIFETYPARLWIDLMAPNPGDQYGVVLVLSLTILMLLAPLVIIQFVMKRKRKARAANAVVESGRTGAYLRRHKHLSAALVAAPVIANGTEIGVIDSGSRIFFDLPVGLVAVQVGKGVMRSEKVHLELQEGDQLELDVRIAQGAFTAKYVLKVL